MSENSETADCDKNERKHFPFDIKPVDPSIEKQLLNDFTGEKEGFVQVGPKNYVFPSSFRHNAAKWYNFEARPDDIWIATFPRSGTTMTQELIWLLENDFDYDRAQKESLGNRCPFFEYDLLFNDELKAQLDHAKTHKIENIETIEDPFSMPDTDFLANASSPRSIKTHLPFSLMPPSIMRSKAKIIYLARNPKDVAVSFYHLNRTFKNHGFVNDFAQFWDYFEKNLILWSPYWEHIKEGWEHRTDLNVLFLFYEDLVKNLPASILKIASFLDKEVNEENLNRLVEHLKIDNFRNNPSVNLKVVTETSLATAAASSDSSFIRVGKVSGRGWQKEYTPELIARAEKWIEQNLRETTLRFPEY